MNNIKAPEELKNKTLCLMKEELLMKKNNIRIVKPVLIVALLVATLSLSAFAYSLFSGIDGDELSLDAQYLGDGKVTITVNNLADKNLQFDEVVRLEQWSTAQVIFETTVDMPMIKAGESGVIEIEIPSEFIAQLEIPLLDTDWYHFLLTTNNFAFGQTWQSSIRFAESIKTEKNEEYPSGIPVEDYTDQNDVDFIKNHFIIQDPLSKIQVSFDFNEYEISDGAIAHPEVDLIATEGTNIYPFASGTVLEAGYDISYGNYMIIDHTRGLVTRYSHCAELFFESGDEVSFDDIIASVGKTGMATGPHLGFAVEFDDEPLNPEKLLETISD